MENKKQKGFIILQIDGLSYNDLLKAIKKGYMPFLKKIINKKNFKLKKIKVGLPSDTPYFQSAIFYGDKDKIPGFRFYLKKEKKIMNFKFPNTASYIDSKYKKEDGILYGGSCYISLLSGGAKKTLFTLSDTLDKNFVDRIYGMKIFLFSILNVFTLIRIISLSIKEFLKEIRDFFYHTLKKNIQRTEGFFPLVRIFNNVIFKEVSIYEIKQDIKNGIKKIYIDFTIYDEASHQRGHDKRSVFSVLRGVDRDIKRIYKYSLKNKNINYDIFILSDHGQTESIPFTYKNEETFYEFLKNIIQEDIKEYVYEEERWYGNILKFAKEIQNKIFKTKRINYLGEKVGKRLEKSINKKIKGEDLKKIKESNIIAMYSCSMANIYFTIKEEPMDIKEIAKYYPSFIKELLSHKDIEIVAGRNNNKKIILGKKGSIISYNKDKYVVIKENPLNVYEDSNFAYLEIVSLLDKENSGDLIVFAKYSEGLTVNFEEQLSAHGGLGGNQNHAFLIYPEKFSDIYMHDLTDLYKFFKKY